jgi:hypothetical protein
MLLVLETRSGVLSLFPSAGAAEARLEAIDVENSEFEFCAAGGQRLVGTLTAPVTAFDPGKFQLRPHGAPDIANVAGILGRARVLAQPYREAATLDDLRRTLGTAPAP